MHKSKLTLSLIIFLLLELALISTSTTKADNTDTATLRIIATGDLHGQVTAYNYEADYKVTNRGLSKLTTLIKQKKNEIGATNTLLVDAGDFLYDYSTNYFYDKDKTLVQPVMKAMSAVGYDFITLGNHEFDYPWSYLSRQLELSGLSNKVLVSNVVWHDSGEPVFSPSAVITKTLTTNNRKTVSVNIGIIGATTNSISSRRGDYVNYIDAVNNYDSILSEAKHLKSTGAADLVLVLLHGGIDTAALNKTSDNIGYTLTKSDFIDAIVTAHTHKVFPDVSYPIGSLKNVDVKTGCINGKPILATLSHARAIGTIDLKLAVNSDGSVQLTGGSSSITYATEAVKEDSTVTSLFDNYLSKLKAGKDQSSMHIKKGITYHNYDTVIHDSNLYQLLNNAKIEYGLSYIAKYLPKYKNIPVLACTRNLPDNKEPFVLLKNSLDASKLSMVISETSLTKPSGYIQLYELSGKALREWLEYNASIYAVQGTTFTKLLQNYTQKNKGVSTLLMEDYAYNWSSQYIFDGISYTVDLTKKARYHSNGLILSNKNSRITSLTYNGVNVKDTQSFILVVDSGMPALSFLPAEVSASIKEVNDYETGKNITLNYIKRLGSFGDIQITADHNWSIKADKDYTFLLGVPKIIKDAVANYSWFSGIAAETASYSFLKGKLPTVTQDINIIATQGRTEMNNQPVPVIVQATSKYSLKEIRYQEGKQTSTAASSWQQSKQIIGNTFSTDKNGIYTLLAVDIKGNRKLSYITVDRYNEAIPETPRLNRLTNRKTAITGFAVPYSIVHITIGADRYTSPVLADGSFTIGIKPPTAFTEISAYIEIAGKKSSVESAAVRKTGPNTVQLAPIIYGDISVYGTADKNTTVYALIRKTVYVGRGQIDLYRKSDFYKPEYNVLETDIIQDQKTGQFQIMLPYLTPKMNVYVFSIDRFGLTSKSTMQTPVY